MQIDPQLLFAPLLLVAATACAGSPPVPEAPADLVLLGGRITTLSDEWPEVSALAVRDGQVVALGSDREIARHRGAETRTLALGGRRVVPGFIEGHAHFVGLGRANLILDLRDTQTWSEVLDLVRAAVDESAPGTWIVGRGWHQEKWTEAPQTQIEGFPTHHSLSAISPHHPVYLDHASGHLAIANARALELAGLGAGVTDPPGGEILRTPDGEPSGVLRETAADLVAHARATGEAERSPGERLEELRLAIELADRECASKGVTSFQDAGSPFETASLLRAMAENGELRTRLWVMLSDSNERLAEVLARARVVGAGDEHFTLRAIKRSLDGALGSRGAWLLEPYSDAPGQVGLNLVTLKSLEETGRLALAHDYQLCVHAIGDRANRETLDVFERLLAGRTDHRWRIEHAQHLHPSDLARFAPLGVVASMQGIHCTSDAPFVEARLGSRRAEEGAYAWRTLLDSGALVSNGTDAPVEDVDPLANFYATVTRRLPDGSTFHAEQRMTRLEALRSLTLDAARAAFEEDRKGSLEPGKLADLVVLSEDILEVPEERLLDARVDLTLVGGEVTYERSRP